MTKKYDLNIFQVLTHIDRKDSDFYSTLTQREQKAFQPLVAMMWMSCTQDARQVFVLNEVVNPYVFSLYEHKELLYKLLTTVSTGNVKRYKWNRKKKSKESEIPIEIISQYFACNFNDAKDMFPLLDSEEIIEMAEDLGYDKVDVTKLKKILK